MHDTPLCGTYFVRALLTLNQNCPPNAEPSQTKNKIYGLLILIQHKVLYEILILQILARNTSSFASHTGLYYLFVGSLLNNDVCNSIYILLNHAMIGEYCIVKELEGSSHDLISLNLPGGNERKHEKSLSELLVSSRFKPSSSQI
jgi:hypothetical protein